MHTLAQLGVEIGLDEATVKDALASNKFADHVTRDIREAQRLGIRGVPYYLFDSKHAVYGAKESGAFLEMLEKAYLEWRGRDKEQFCSVGGNC